MEPKPNHRCGRREPFDPNHASPFKPPYGDGGEEFPDAYQQIGGEERCSYCGAVSGDSFMAFAEAGGQLGPTDKGYKVYLEPTEGVQRPGMKFYFQHLSDEQRTRFIELINARTLKIGYPGYFYVLPYFCKRIS